MRVFFNHLAKCGGTTINAIAKSSYGGDYHVISDSTTPEEVSVWLDKSTAFITSEIYSVQPGVLAPIIENPAVVKILLARDPIDRFSSFCAHSTRDSVGITAGSAF